MTANSSYIMPASVASPKLIKPEDITMDDLRYMSKDSLAMWALTSGIKVDNNELDFDTHRYLLPIYMDNSKEIVWRKAAQLGATVYMLLRVLWWLEKNQGRKAGLYFPTKEGVENLSKDRLTPMIDSCPSISKICTEEDKLGLRRIGTSSFYLYHLGGRASKDSIPLDFMAFDEVRLCNPKDIDQALERMAHSKFKYRILMSTCFDGDQHIIVRKKPDHHTRWKVSPFIEKKSFKELESCWQGYQALSVDHQTKQRLVFRDITAFHNNGHKEVVKVTFDDASEVICTPDHKFAWCDSYGKQKNLVIRYDKIEDMMSSYSDNRRTYDRNNPVFVRDIHSYQEMAAPYDLLTYYIFGAYVAEGCIVTNTTHTISIAQLPGRPIYLKTIEWAKRHGFNYSEQKTCVRVSLCTRPDLYKLFESSGTLCEEKHIPKEMLNASKQQLEAFLEGYIEGDGTQRNPNMWESTTISPQLVKDLKFVALRTGAPAYHRERVQCNKPVYNMGCYNGKNKIKTKSRLLGKPLNEHLRAGKIVSIEKQTTQVPVYDITVDIDHNFVLDNGALVHNCGYPNVDIDARFQLGTQHTWTSFCGCKDGCNLATAFPNCIVYDDPKRPKEVYLRCPVCRYEIKDPQNGRYIPHNPGADYNSYAVSQLVSKYITPKEIWDFYNRTTNMSEFYNSKLGLPFIDEINRGVTRDQLNGCVDTTMSWYQNSGTKEHTVMGVDQGLDYLVCVLADINPDGTKKRIRHVEVIERSNHYYYENNEPASPYNRLHTIMKDFNVGMAVIDGMPNFSEALQFAQQYPGKVFLANYADTTSVKDTVVWNDRARPKEAQRKAGPFLKFKYTCSINRFNAMSLALSEWSQGNVRIPNPEGLKQMCRSEKNNMIEPEAVALRLFNHLACHVRQFKEVNEETGKGTWQWTHTSPHDHLAHAWLYCNIGLERYRRRAIFTFANED